MSEPHKGHEQRPASSQAPQVPLSDATFLEQLGVERVEFELPTDVPPPVPKEWFEFNLARTYKELDPSGSVAEIIVELENGYREADAELTKAQERGLDNDELNYYRIPRALALVKREVFLRIYNGILTNKDEIENLQVTKEEIIDQACKAELIKLMPEKHEQYDRAASVETFELIQQIALAYKMDLYNSRLENNPL